MDYKMSFWNYVPFGKLDNAAAVQDWKELGMSLPMTFEYNPEQHTPAQMLSLLDECAKNGMKAIVCDSRTRFSRYVKEGEEAFIAGVKAAVADFGSHPANFGFHVGDEPTVQQFEGAIAACQIVGKLAPHLQPFINLLPFWDGDDSQEAMLGVTTAKEYAAKLDDFVKRSGVKILAYDCYSQCAYFQREKYRNDYFRNLRIFGEVARANGIELWTSLLSVGHWSLRVPTADDLRWQLSTAISHGVSCIQWFFIYCRDYDGSFREAPIDEFWTRTETFGKLARENKVFMQYLAPLLADYEFDKVEHYNESVDAGGGFEVFKGTEELKKITYVINATPISVTRFVNKEGKVAYAIVNLSQTEPTKIRVDFEGALSKHKRAYWFAPGQMTVYTEDRMI